MKRRSLIKGALGGFSALYLNRMFGMGLAGSSLADGPFKPAWASLEQYTVPDWYRDAKFGLWAHWGPQCEPGYGDWYGQGMYKEGSDQYNYHCKKYGHPSKFGFKDVINEWKADKWDPEALVSLYKSAGARYFVAMANHHDNFDLFPNKYQRWNSTKLGPKKDIIGGWARAAQNNNLPFGVSIHASHAWSWFEVAQMADKTGPYAGVPYDGNTKAAQGNGKWWDGYDPQELYAQSHPLSNYTKNDIALWNWGEGAYPPSKAYCERFYNRISSLINTYDPELLYFDDTALPLWPVSDARLRIAAGFYNKSLKKHGKLNAVITGKILNEQQRKCMVWDIERGQSNKTEPLPWQTDTCIGNWHYDERVYNDNKYKTSATIIHTLADVVSKNGNLLLSIPVKGNGTIDEKERVIVDEIAAWMNLNGEAIYGTRPWKVFGEGPAAQNEAPLDAQGFNEGKGQAFTNEDIRFTKKGNVLYAIMMAWPHNGNTIIKSLGNQGKVAKVTMLGSHPSLEFKQSSAGLHVKLPQQAPCKSAFVLKLEGELI